MGPERGTLIVLAKWPRPGQVKTRLARDIGVIAATWWARHQLARLRRRLGGDPRWRLVLAVSPDPAAARWPGAIPQGRGDLGRRMARALAAQGPGPVVLIGADIPGITPTDIARALQLARGQDWVIGPSPDGGYWLIGLRHAALARRAGVLAGVRWSTGAALADTLASLGPARVGRVRVLADVDTAADLASQPR